MIALPGGRTVCHGAVAVRESPLVYPVQPEVPEAIDRLLAEFGAARAPLKVLEIGTGTGIIACALAAAGHAVTAVDILPGAVSLARRNARDNNVAIDLAVSDLCRGVTGLFDRVFFNVPNTVAVTPWGTFLQYLGARLLAKPLVEKIGCLLARRVLRNTVQKRALYARLLGEVRSQLRPGGMLVLLVPAAEVEFVTGDPAVVSARVEALRAASGVRLLFLSLTAPAPP